eukprot:TRINITY_DN2922_c0_g1_i5.p1 TRINITY_DN2922_c0_g1~~TRINITY_DN2922_c0_g1_i5.p1  ORF type:complete len:417 (-),score=112.74 TRINITY_DN2922_c0_g1_i5:123-1373(-)
MGLSVLIGILLILIALIFGNVSGIGGTSIIVPALLVNFSLDLLEASALANFLICISFTIQYCFNFHERHPHKNKPIIDYDTISLIVPSALLGAKVSIIIHDTFPHTALIGLLSLISVMLAWDLYKQRKSLYSEATVIPAEDDFNLSIISGSSNGSEFLLESKAPEQVKAMLKYIEEREATVIPLKRALMMLLLLMVFMITTAVEGGRNFPSLLGFPPCSASFWATICFFAVTCVVFVCINAHDITRFNQQKDELGYKIHSNEVVWTWCKIGNCSFYGFFAGVFSVIFGTGGGMIIAPVLVRFKQRPETVASTSGFFVMFTSAASMATLAYEGEWELYRVILMAIASVASSLFSLYTVNKIIERYGNPAQVLYIMMMLVLINGIGIAIAVLYYFVLRFGSVFAPDLWDFHNFCDRLS